MILTVEATRGLSQYELPGLTVGQWWVYRLLCEPVEYTAGCPDCGDDITWVCWWFEGVPLQGGLKQDNVTATECGPCICDGVQVVREEEAAT